MVPPTLVGQMGLMASRHLTNQRSHSNRSEENEYFLSKKSKVLKLDSGRFFRWVGRFSAKSIEKLATQDKGTLIYNIGTGRGYSVKEMLEAFRRISGQEIKAVVGPRREGDIGECTADPTLANDELGWRAQLGLDEMVASAWKWQSENPRGYKQ